MANNYKVTKTNTKREFTIPQTQALRTLYGFAAQLVRNASSPAVPEMPESKRIIQGGDFLKLVEALENVKRAMRKD